MTISGTDVVVWVGGRLPRSVPFDGHVARSRCSGSLTSRNDVVRSALVEAARDAAQVLRAMETPRAW